MRYFVTGGTGFVGKNLVRRLADGTHEVRVLARTSSNTEGLDLPGVTRVTGDMADHDSLRRGMEGCDRVFHMAALVKEWAKDKALFDKINVDGVDAICRIAKELGVERVVRTSSFIAIGQTDGIVADERAKRDPNHLHNDYERTKYLADGVAARHVADGVPLISVYPGVIYGPGELTDGNIAVKMLLDHMNEKLPGIPGDGERKWTYAYVDDVVDGHLLAMEKGTVGARYILGGEVASANRFFETFESVSGVPKPTRHVPYWVLKTVAALCELRAALFGTYPMITRGAVEVYKHDWAYDCSKAKNELGYACTPLEEGLRKTHDWLISEVTRRDRDS